MNNTNEAKQRYEAMAREWAGLGHPEAACSGTTYPLSDCPAPGVHAQVFPEETLLTLDKVLNALKAVFENLDSTGRAGDEWAYEWIHEVWPALVPLVVRKAVGDREALEDGA
jgi:hypothetical protein